MTSHGSCGHRASSKSTGPARSSPLPHFDATTRRDLNTRIGRASQFLIYDLQELRVLPDQFEIGVARQLRLVGGIDGDRLAQRFERFAPAIELEIKIGEPQPHDIAV